MIYELYMKNDTASRLVVDGTTKRMSDGNDGFFGSSITLLLVVVSVNGLVGPVTDSLLGSVTERNDLSLYTLVEHHR